MQTVAAVPALAVAAEATTTLRIGSRMFCVGYHQPVVLAKEAATLDFFSEGRLELGLGAGWLENEYDAMGIPFPRAGARIDALRETVDLLQQSFAGGQVEVDGTHVRVHGFEAVPRPVQKPGPPLMIGGGAPAGAADRRRARRHREHQLQQPLGTARHRQRRHVRRGRDRREGRLGPRGCR